MRTRLLAAVFLALQLGLQLIAQTTESGPKTYPAGATIAPASGSVTTLTTNGNVTVASGADVTYRAAGQIVLESGFNVADGGVFRTEIIPPTAPAITSGSATAFTAGQAGQFTVQASGTIPIAYGYTGTLPSWATFNASTGVLSGTPPDAAGSPFALTLTATNGGGNTTQNFTLTVGVPPTITVQPASQTAYVGGAAALSITASGTGPFTYQWKLNGAAIAGATNATYTIGTVQTSHAGTYSVIVTGAGGVTTSADATITVPAPVDGVTWNFIDIPEYLRPGQMQRIRANVTNSGTTVWNSNYTITATADGAPALAYAIPTAVLPGMSVDIPFAITASTSNDANWRYDFTIAGPSGAFGTPVTKGTQVSDWLTAIFTVTSPTFIIATAGQTTTYQTTLNSNPVWYLGSWTSQGVGYSRFDGRTGKFEITPFEAGLQSFNVGAGFQSWPDYDYGRELVTLVVTSPSSPVSPGPVTVPGVVNVSLGWFSVNLTTAPAVYTTSGTLPPGITFDPAWRRFSGTPTQGGTTTVTVTAATATGTISVPVTFGIAATVDAPTAPGPLSATGVTSSSLTLNWGASTTSVGIERYILLVDGFTTIQSIGSQTSVTLGGYDPGSTHTFRVQGKDIAGNYSPWSNDFTVQFQSSGPTIATQPQSQTVSVGAAAQISVVANGSGLSYQWRKNGGNVSGATQSTLSFSNIQASDAGSYSVVISNSVGSVTSNAAVLTVIGLPVITSASAASGNVGNVFENYTVTATNSPTSFEASGLPSGLAIDVGTGAITGTPTTAGSYTVTLSATNGIGTGTATLTLTVGGGGGTSGGPTVAWLDMPASSAHLVAGKPFVVRAQGAAAAGNLANVTVTVTRPGDTAAHVFAVANASNVSSLSTPMLSFGALTPGNYTFRAQATNSQGAKSATIVSTVTLVAPAAVANVSPVISWISAPSTVAVGQSFTVQAKAEDADGNLAAIALWRNNTLVDVKAFANVYTGSSNAIAYSQATAGTVVYTAQATDVTGAKSALQTLIVTITNDPPRSDAVDHTTAAGASDLIGTLPGSLTIDNKGTANYSIALALPPGRAGLQPSLSLNYNSGGGNGPVGVGWSIGTGFPQAITRGRSILARDGYVSGPNFGSDDRLYLDGRRLIQTNSGVADYWAANNEYRTEVDSFANIAAKGIVGGNSPFQKTIIGGFTEALKDGSVADFGSETSLSDSAIECPLSRGAARDLLIRAWSLRQVTDTLGNRVAFEYNNYTRADGLLTGEHTLKRIEYTSNPSANIAGQVQVRFVYTPDDIPGSTTRPDVRESYLVLGSETRRRLAAVEIDVRNGASWETVRKYGFIYATSAGTGLSQLKYITSAWKDNLGGDWKSLPSTALTYDAPASGAPMLGTPGIGYTPAHDQFDNRFVGTGDFDGDGKTDRFVNNTAYLSNGSSFTAGTISIDYAATGSGQPSFVKIADLDGDGKSDLVWMGNAVDIVYAARSTGSGFEPLSGPGGSYVAIAATKEWFDAICVGVAPGARASRVALGDFNGDGRVDILLHLAGDSPHPRGLYVARNIGGGFATPEAWGGSNSADVMRYYDYLRDSNNPNSMQQVYDIAAIEPMVGDYNGDGMDDYAWVCRYTTTFAGANETIYSTDFSLNVVYSRGGLYNNQNFSGFSDVNTVHWQGNATSFIPPEDYNLHVTPTDVNGDGLPDFMVLGRIPSANQTWKTGWILYKNTKFGFTTQNDYMPASDATSEGILSTYNLRYKQELKYGFQDIWFEGGGGQYQSASSKFETTSENQQSGGMFFVDLNHDGLPDYLWGIGADAPYGSGWWVKCATPSGFGPPQKLWDLDALNFGGINYSPYTDFDSGRTGGVSLESVDFDGDGATDYVLSARYDDTTGYGPVLVKGVGPHWDRLTKATDGFGAETQIAYSSLAEDAVYTPGASVKYPIRERRGGQHVVSDVLRESGAGAQAHFKYQYSGNRFDLSGRGSLGFHSFVTLDTQTNVLKYQFLTQSFPMTGLTAREETYRYLGDGQFRFISAHDNTVVFDEVVKSAADSTRWGTVYPFISKAIESRWEDASTPHFTVTATGPNSAPEALFPKTRPPGAHIQIGAESNFDSQTAPQTSIPTVTGVPNFYASDTNGNLYATTGTVANVVTGVTSYSAIQSLGLPGKLYYGNLRKLTTSYDAGLTETVATDYLTPVGSMTGLVGNVTTTVTSPGYGTEAAPVKRYTYFGSTPLVGTETTDATDANLDLTTTYTRDSLGRVTDTSISNTTATGLQAIGSYSVGNATVFDARFDLPTTQANAVPYRHTTATSYHPLFGRPVSVTDANNAQVTTLYDAMGRAVTTTDVLKGLSTHTTFAWTEAGASDWKKAVTVAAPTEVNDAITASSSYAVRTEATVQPPVTVYYDRLGRAIRSVKEGFGSASTITDTVYDVLGRVVGVSLPYRSSGSPLWTKTKYDALGRVSTVTAPNGTVTTTTYNGRATTVEVKAKYGVTDLDAQKTSTVVNAKGQTIKVWNADNVPTFSDTSGATSSTPSITFDLDGFGRMRTTALKDQTPTISATYDELGRQLTLSDPDKGNWSYLNNALGQVVSQQDAALNATTSTYDRLGRLLTRTLSEQAGPTETTNWYYYDSDATASAHPELQLVEKGTQGWIGALQRAEVTTASAPGYAATHSGTSTTHYYDDKGRPWIDLTTIDDLWYYTYTEYDAYSRVRERRYLWQPAGISDPSSGAWQEFGTTTTYNDKSYVLSIADTTTPARTWWQADATAGYDYLDRPVLVRKGSGYWTKRTYRDNDGALTAIKTGVAPDGTEIQDLSFNYDGLGNLRTRSGSGGSETLDYDVLNRLTSGKQGTISYFPNGNIRQKPNVAGTAAPADFEYNATVTTAAGSRDLPHAVSKAWGYTLGYDANGNLATRTNTTASESWNFNYTGFDKPRWMTKKVGSTTAGSEFLYDANRSRTVHLEYDQANATTGEPTHYVRKRIYGLGSSLEVNYDNTSTGWHMNKVRVYVPGPDGVIGTRELNPDNDQETALVYHYDHLGSIESITPFAPTSTNYAADSASKPGRFSEDAWGSRRNPSTWSGAPTATDDGGSDSLTPRGFTGHEMLDDLGLVHMNGRIYDPLIGRMLTPDIIVQYPSDLQSYNRYSYVRNNPMTLIDPTGFADAATATAVILLEEGAAGSAAAGPAALIFGGSALQLKWALEGRESMPMYPYPCGMAIDTLNRNYEIRRADQVRTQQNSQQAASSSVTTPKEPVDVHGETAKPKETTSGGQTDVNGKEKPQTGQTGLHGDLTKQAKGSGLQSHESPSNKAQEKVFIQDYIKKNGRAPTAKEIAQNRKQNPAVLLPAKPHQQTDTFGGKNTAAKSSADAADIDAAAERGARDLKKVGENNGLDLTKAADELLQLHKDDPRYK